MIDSDMIDQIHIYLFVKKGIKKEERRKKKKLG